MSLIPSLTQGSSRSRHNGLYQIAQPNEQADRIVGQRTAAERISDAAWSSAPPVRTRVCSDGAVHKARAADWTRRLPKKARGRSFYRALGCGDGVAGVPVVVGAFSTVHVMALRSYLWPGAFFNASFVVFMTG